MTQEIKHTPGPWFINLSNSDALIFRRPINELYEFGGGVAGDKPLAIVNKGWYEEDQVGFPYEANARLIAAAPDMYEALKEAQKTLAMMISPDAIKQTTVLNAYAAAVEAEYKARQALAKAKGETA